ncbi:MAG: Mur ligase [Hyphomicrobium sp.]|nr:MAG: Mur ligase [Hyphomicrobium sp.]PPD01613.1 MAG: Mur ligase [Hyphomicrobium sp.]
MKRKADYRRVRDWCKSRVRLVRSNIIRNNTSACVIGVTGSSAKSTTTLLLAHILSGASQVRCTPLSNGISAVTKSLIALRHDDQFLVAEAGAEKPGDIDIIARALRPDVAVVTLVALEHKSAFHSTNMIMHEKSHLVCAVQPGGFVVLNKDDPLVMQMSERTSQRVVTFGRSAQSIYRADNINGHFPQLLSLEIKSGNRTLQLSSKFVGEHFWLPIAAATATAIELGISPEIIAERVASFEPVFGRCSVMSVPNGPSFVFDCVKAPWHSLQLAFNIIEKGQAVRKRIVLGHLSDYKGNNKKYHYAYVMARNIADEVIFVGNHAHRSKASIADRENGRFKEFDSAKQAAEYISRTSIEGELILLKGSKDLHLERIALACMNNVNCWATACGKSRDCVECGLYEMPFADSHSRLSSVRTKVFGYKRDKRAAQKSSADAM